MTFKPEHFIFLRRVKMKRAVYAVGIGIPFVLSAGSQAAMIDQPGNVIPNATLVASGGDNGGNNVGQDGNPVTDLQDGNIDTDYIFWYGSPNPPFVLTATLSSATDLSSIGAYFPDQAVTNPSSQNRPDRDVGNVTFAYSTNNGNSYTTIPTPTTITVAPEESSAAVGYVDGTFTGVTNIEYTFTELPNDQNGEPRAYEAFADAVPEPASIALMGLGSVGLLIRRRARC
jgi:hypothetical protein